MIDVFNVLQDGDILSRRTVSTPQQNITPIIIVLKPKILQVDITYMLE
jgi:hypothetical protein